MVASMFRAYAGSFFSLDLLQVLTRKPKTLCIQEHKWQCDNVERVVTLLYNKRLHGLAHRMTAYDQTGNMGVEEGAKTMAVEGRANKNKRKVHRKRGMPHSQRTVGPGVR